MEDDIRRQHGIWANLIERLVHDKRNMQRGLLDGKRWCEGNKEALCLWGMVVARNKGDVKIAEFKLELTCCAELNLATGAYLLTLTLCSSFVRLGNHTGKCRAEVVEAAVVVLVEVEVV
jgi:hypothetical protein